MVIDETMLVASNWSEVYPLPIKKSDHRKYIILKLKQANPNMTLQAIGDVVGCTREYVRIVLNKSGVSTYRPPMIQKLCTECKQPISRHRAYRTSICKECSYMSRRIETVCPNCNKSKLSLKSHIKRHTQTFCNNQCQFSYMGKVYGFKAHPENSVHGKSENKKVQKTSTKYWLQNISKPLKMRST